MNRQEIKRWLKNEKEFALSIMDEEAIEEDGYGTRTLRSFLGTVFNLDPCGKYHDPFGFNPPDGKYAQLRICERFWDSMNKVAQEIGCYIDSGEGDPCDVFLIIPLAKENEK